MAEKSALYPSATWEESVEFLGELVKAQKF